MTLARREYQAQAETQDFALPSQEKVTDDLAALHAFQGLIQSQLKEGHDYGVIPGTENRPTLLKPGAEKITKLLGLAEQYDIEASTEDWDKPLFRYLIRCRLVAIRTGQEITQGFGECNSMEAKYRWRWAFLSQLPPGVDHSQLVRRSIRTRNGLAKQYRLDNEDIYAQVNTILKMAKKRALVDAALSVGRLSDLFTQDLEEMRESAPQAEATEPAQEPAPEAQGAPPETARHVGKDITPAEWQTFYDWAAEKHGIENPEGVHMILGKSAAEWTGTLRDAAALLEAAKKGIGIIPYGAA